MDQTELCFTPATELAGKVRARELSPVEVVEAYLARIERINPVVNAYCTVTADLARAEARRIEAAILRGEAVGPLAGVPVSIKDLLITKGIRTTRGSSLFADVVPTEDAPVVERLRAAGAISLGKTNTPEFGWKGVTDNRLFGPTRNPWQRDRTSGGSSGGAGAAVAAGLGPLAIGTDGGGSIRIPASFCGIFGLKPTFGLVPAYPPSWAEALAHTGPMTRTVRDAALLLNAIVGLDRRDRNSYPVGPVDFLDGIGAGVRRSRVAWSPDLGYATVDPAVASACAQAALRFEGLAGAVELASPGFPDVGRAWEALFYAGIGAAVDALPAGWDSKVDPGLVGLVRRSRSGTAFDLARAYQERAQVYDVTRRFFERYDLLLTPSIAVPAFEVGVDSPREIAGRPAEGLSWSPFTLPFNLTGQPAATVPCGWTADGLPIGLQIVGRRFEDALVLRAAAAFEDACPWAGRRPDLL
ncbi:MAG TPA: amidase [Chloroflexota bacterium]|nr:amidase [Chloroflexota bacterium]